MIITDPEVTPVGFAETYLRGDLPDDQDFLADWQARAVMPLTWAKVGGKRVNISIVAPNGSGKDQRIIPTAVYWWLFMYPKGRVVITSKSDLQITGQTIPAIESYYHRFGWPEPVKSPRFTLRNGKGDEDQGFCIAFVTNDAGRVEGWHERPDSPLLLIINEAKSVTNDIYVGLDRCTPTACIQVSSPGFEEGRFWDTHNSIPGWIRIKAGLADCPWIPQSKIDDIIAKHGPDDPVTRSILHGEFMKRSNDVYYVLYGDEYDACVAAPPQHRPGFQYGFFDFADGRAENVFVRRDGNKYWIEDAWRDKSEDAVVGRAIYLCAKSGLRPEQLGADAAAKSILDKMAASQWPIGRFNFGTPVKNSDYSSWSAMAWIEGAGKIKRREVIVPNDEDLREQITVRRKLWTPAGKLTLEDKLKMKKERGYDSPDRADALFGAMAQQDNTLLVPRSQGFNFGTIDNNSFRRGSRVGL